MGKQATAISTFHELCGSVWVNLFGLEKSIALLNRVLFNLHFLETVADVDEVLGEMFLEEIQPTEAQLIVGILGFHLSCDQIN